MHVSMRTPAPETLLDEATPSKACRRQRLRVGRAEEKLAARALSLRGRPLSKAKAAANRAKSRIRRRVEHVFGAQEKKLHTGGRLVRTIGMIAALLDTWPGLPRYNIRRLGDARTNGRHMTARSMTSATQTSRRADVACSGRTGKAGGSLLEPLHAALEIGVNMKMPVRPDASKTDI